MSRRATLAGPALGLLVACSGSKQGSLVLSIFDAAGVAPGDVGVTPRVAPVNLAAALSLAFGGSPVEVPQRLTGRLAAASDAAVLAANPLAFALDDGDAAADPRGALAGALQGALPAATAAANLIGAWSGPGLRVELGAACAPGAARCLPLFSDAPADDSLARRARGLVWALSHAAILRSHAPAELARALRQRQPGSSTIALVFTQTSGVLDEGQLAALRRQAARALAHLAAKASGRVWIEAMARVESSWRLPVALAPDEILVVPRLGALARLGDFEAELAKAGSFEWVARPGG